MLQRQQKIDVAAEAGHGGIDFFIMNAFVESAKQNIAPPMDVYDAAASFVTDGVAEGDLVHNITDDKYGIVYTVDSFGPHSLTYDNI